MSWSQWVSSRRHVKPRLSFVVYFFTFWRSSTIKSMPDWPSALPLCSVSIDVHKTVRGKLSYGRKSKNLIIPRQVLQVERCRFIKGFIDIYPQLIRDDYIFWQLQVTMNLKIHQSYLWTQISLNNDCCFSLMQRLWVLDCTSDKRGHFKKSLLALRNCDEHSLWSETINRENL